MPAPSDAEIREAVLAQKEFVARLFGELAAGSRRGEGIWRDTYGPGEQFAHKVMDALAGALGLERKRDAASNLYMTLPGRDRKAPRVIMGSHLDSVANGGNFDGAAGVVAGLVAIQALKRLGITPACDVTAMGIRAEESVWFQVSYIGSRAAFGMLPDGALQAKRVDTGRTLAEHMKECGADVEALENREAELTGDNVRAFLEVHIEQAPQLLDAAIPVGIGTGVPGNFRYPNARILGQYDHVGLPRRFRHDAVLAGSDFALGMDEIWKEWDEAGKAMAFTIGRFYTDAAEHAMTKIAGEMQFSLDVRAYEEVHLADLEARMMKLIAGIETDCRVRFDLGKRASALPGPSDRKVYAAMTEAAAALGVKSMPLPSPASHDSATFANAGVPTTMLFVRNANGSHNPKEAMEIDDFLDAASVLTHWVVREVG